VKPVGEAGQWLLGGHGLRYEALSAVASASLVLGVGVRIPSGRPARGRRALQLRRSNSDLLGKEKRLTDLR
jgi:hypothetical protein